MRLKMQHEVMINESNVNWLIRLFSSIGIYTCRSEIFVSSGKCIRTIGQIKGGDFRCATIDVHRLEKWRNGWTDLCTPTQITWNCSEQSKSIGLFSFLHWSSLFVHEKVSQQTQLNSQIQQMFETIKSNTTAQETVREEFLLCMFRMCVWYWAIEQAWIERNG